MILLHTSVDGDRETFREHATWKWFDTYDRAIDSQGWDVYHITIRKGKGHEFDYDKVMRSFWGKDDLFVFERDMVPHSWQQVMEVAACPERSCAIDYPLTRCYLIDAETRDGSSMTPNRVTTKEGELVSNHLLICVEHQVEMSMMKDRPNPPVPGAQAIWNPGNWTHCDVPVLGLTRLRKEVMRDIPPLWPRTHWLDVDQMVGNTLALNGQRTHIHYPMATHQRRFKPNECAFVATLPRQRPIVPFAEVFPQHQWKIRQKFEQTRSHTSFEKVIL
jgi:hypothetical protein